MYIEVAKKHNLSTTTDIHIKCWSEVYSFIPDKFHNARTYEYRLRQWQEIYIKKEYGSALFVLRSPSGKVVGFCYCMQNKDMDIDAKSELHAAYILPEWRGGISGPLMMQVMVQYLLHLKLSPICLWAFDNNPIQRWYQMMGWKKVVRRNRTIEGIDIPESGFICPKPDKLLRRLNSIIDAKTEQLEIQ